MTGKLCSLTYVTSPVRPKSLTVWSTLNIAAQRGLKTTPSWKVASEVSLPHNAAVQAPSCLARLPTSALLRSLFLSLFFTSPLLFRPGLAVFRAIAESPSAKLDPDRNPLLRSTIRPLVYDQFCAGRDAAEIAKTSSLIKQLGFSGIVLCYGKEVQLDASGKSYGYSSKDGALAAEIKEWRDGNLETLNMIGQGDWLGIKYTGAGLGVTSALKNGESAPTAFVEAMDDICRTAATKGCRIWIDAEQQILQTSIDNWTFDLMRKYNRGEKALLYNTVQAYLKSARSKVQHQLETAANEGWRSGIKLVRGAYISNDIRTKIHDTKEQTDACYNSIVNDLLRGQEFQIFNSNPNIQHDLLLAGHNTQTVRMANQLASDLAAAGKLKVVPDFAQLQGMADDIGCELLQSGEQNGATFVPKVYKCLTWGSIRECMQYLTRRLVENRGAADRMREGAALMRKELWRRTFRLG